MLFIISLFFIAMSSLLVALGVLIFNLIEELNGRRK